MGFQGQAVFGGTTDPVVATWNNATALNSAVTSSDITGYGVVVASFVSTGSVTQGTAIFEVSDDGGTTWWPIAGLQTGNSAQATSTVLTGGSVSFEFATGAYNLFRVRLNPVITGSGSVAIRLSAEAFPFTTALAVAGTVSVVTVAGNNTVRMQDGSGNAITSTSSALDVNIKSASITQPVSLTSTTITGTVAVTQSTSPWVVSGTVTANIGTTGGLALDTSVNGILVAQGSTTSGEKGPLVQGAVTTAAPAYTTAQTSPLSLTLAGALRVDGSGVTQPVSGTVTANQGGAPWTVKPDGTVWSLTGTSANVDVTNTVADNLTQINGNAAITVANGVLKVGISDSAGNAITSNSATQSRSLDINVVSVLGATMSVTNPAFTSITDGTTKAGVIAGTTALKTDLSSVAGTATVTAAAGVAKVGVVGATGVAHDGATGSAVPANAIFIGGTDGTNLRGLLTDSTGKLQVASTSGAADTVGSTAALNALNATAQVAMTGETSGGFLLAAGTFIGTIVPELSMDGGTTWTGTYFFDPATLSFSATLIFAASNGATQRTILAAGGTSHIRVRVSAFTSGTANATLRSAVGASGAIFTSSIDGEKNTYRACTALFYTSAATPTDSAILSGSSTKTIRISKIFVQPVAASNSGLINMQIIKRSAANTGGTFVSDATNILPMDSNDPATTVATFGHYTANPTSLGAQIGIIDQAKMLLPTSPNAFQVPLEFDFGSLPGAKAIVLRGTSQFCAVNFNSSALPTGGMTVSVVFQYTEE